MFCQFRFVGIIYPLCRTRKAKLPHPRKSTQLKSGQMRSRGKTTEKKSVTKVNQNLTSNPFALIKWKSIFAKADELENGGKICEFDFLFSECEFTFTF